jgi:hypothetical protein
MRPAQRWVRGRGWSGGTWSCNRCGTDTAVQSISSNNQEREGEGCGRVAIENRDNRESDKEGTARASARTVVQARRAWMVSGAAGRDKYNVSGQEFPSCHSREKSRVSFQHSHVALIIEIRGDDFLNNIPKSPWSSSSSLAELSRLLVLHCI